MRLFGLFLVFGLMAVVVAGCVRFTDSSGKELPLRFSQESGFYVESHSSSLNFILKALVKGSIYESGELVSVFGTCLDGNDRPVLNATGFLSSWYPNGTAQVVNISMSEIQQGYFLYQSSMDPVQGTYLTQFECQYNGSSAYAWGEWQNPFWVRRLALLNESLSNLTVTLGNVTVNANLSGIYEALNNLSYNISDGFNITWTKIDQLNATVTNQFNNLTQQIFVVGQIANSSVDRNDSLLALLLFNLTNLVTPVNLSGTPINHTEDPGRVRYWRNWNIRVDTFDSSGGRVEFPESYCNINTTLTPAITLMAPEGNHFKYTEFINSRDPFVWAVSCYWA